MAIIDFKATKCRHCYKCVRNCEVKAIMVKDGRAEIMPDNCVLCGRCLQICPQSAKTLVSDLSMVKDMIEAGEKVVVSLAPSYMGLLKFHTIGQVRCALMRLGFADVRETSEGAALVTAEYAKLLSDGTMENIISTCCPSVNALIEKYYPQLIPYLAPVVSPMIAHGRWIKDRMGQHTKVVFIGPCVAKKMEAEADARTRGCVDAVIEFNELQRWLEEEGIELKHCQSRPFANQDPMVNQLYPITNGIIRAVDVCGAPGTYKKLTVSSIKSCREFLHSMKRGYISHCFVELNLCAGGCVNGPGVDKRRGFRFKATMRIENNALLAAPPAYITLPKDELERTYIPRQVVDKMPTEAEIQAIFNSFGKSEVVSESMIDTVIGVSGSSPAYVYMFIEAMADAAVADGMPRAQAYKFAAQAVLGSAKMVLETGKHPGELKDAVCSPGGTTIEAVATLEKAGLRNAVIEAQRACVQKSRDMNS